MTERDHDSSLRTPDRSAARHRCILAGAALALLLTGAPAAAQEPAPGEQLLPVLPERAGEWTRTSERFHPSRVQAQATYEKGDGACTVALDLGHGPEPEDALRRLIDRGRTRGDEGAVREREHASGPIYYLRDDDSERLGLIVFPNEVSGILMVEDAAACTGAGIEAAEVELLGLYEALEPDRLAAFTPDAAGGAGDAAQAARGAAAGVDAPAGFTARGADFGPVRIALAHPEGWLFRDLSDISAMLRGISIFRDADAARELFSDGFTMSSDARHRLVTPDNVMITVSVMGEGLDPEQFMEIMMGRVSLDEAEVVQPVEETSVAGRTVYEGTARGLDEDGRPAVYRQMMFTVDGQLIQAAVLRSPDVSAEVEERIGSVLESVVVEVE